MSEKQSQFIEVESLTDSDDVPIFGNGVNRRISKENLFDQIKDELFNVFIYPTIADLQAAPLMADFDSPTYVRVEETEYRLYKITNLAPGVGDIVLSNGNTASVQEEYSEIGFVVGPSPSIDNSIALFNGATGTQIKNGPIIGAIGQSLISATTVTDTSYIKVNSDETVSMRTLAQMQNDLGIDVKVTGPASVADSTIAVFDGVSGKLVKSGEVALNLSRRIDSWSSISSVPVAQAGQLFLLSQHTSGGVGGSLLISKSGSVADDGGTKKNSATGGYYLERLRQITVDGINYGALPDTATNQSAAVQAALNANPKYLSFATGDYKIDTALTGNLRIGGYGISFSGANPPDAWCPVRGMNYNLEMTGDNAIIGAALNARPANTAAFPTGTTGYGRSNNAGNQVFGLFGRADLYNTGVATNEVNSFNFFAAATTSLPPNRGIGTPQTVPVALTVASGGTFTSAIGIHVVPEGGTPNKFNTGMYFNPDSCVTFGLYVGADATNSPVVSAKLENSGAGTNLVLQTKGATTPSNSVITIVDSGGAVKFAAKQDGHLFFSSGIVQISRGAAGGGTALPATPTGYLQIEIGGAQKVIPYYEP